MLSGPEWQAFRELNPVRAAFTDFDAAPAVKDRPDLLKSVGYSSNDIDLVATWFFADPELAAPRRLAHLLAPLQDAHMRGYKLGNASLAHLRS